MDPEISHPSPEPRDKLIRRFTAACALVILLAAGVLIWRVGRASLLADAARLGAWLGQMGGWAPAGIILLNALQALVSPLPGQPLNLLSGYLYGPFLGTLLSLAGTLLGSAVGLLLVRKWGRPLAVWLIGPEWVARADVFLRRRGSLVLLVAFLVPFLPDDTICLLAGLSPLPIPWILLLAAVGRTPGIFTANLLGYSGRSLQGWEWGAVAAAAGILLFLFWRWSGRLEELAWRWSERLGAPGPSAEESP
ncbi:MAG: TVP38/TMEM64 family protein [Anaerolineae bacterium]